MKGGYSSGSSTRITLRRITLVFILTGGGFLRLLALGQKSLWRDEIETMLFALSPLKEVIHLSLTVPFIPRPPFYFIISHFFMKIKGSVAFLRLPAALSAILTLFLLYYLARRLFGVRPALLGVFLMAVSPFQIYYAQEGREYAFLMLLSLLALAILEAAPDRGPWSLILWTAVCLAILYTHHFGAVIVATQAVIAPVLFWMDSREGRLKFKVSFPAFLLALALVLILWQPMLTHLLGGLAGPRGMRGFSLSPAFSLAELKTMVGLMGLGNGPGTFIVPLLALIGFYPSRRDECRRGLVISFLWLAPAVTLTLFGQFAHVFRVRYLIFIIPIYLLMVARGSTVLDDLAGIRFGKGVERKGESPFPAVSLGLVILSFFWVYPYISGYFAEEKQNWKAAAAFLQEASGEEDRVVVSGKGGEDINLHHFVLDHYAGLGERTVILHLAGTYEDELRALLEEDRPLWYVRTEPKDPGRRPGMYPFQNRPELLRDAGFTALSPISFGTGSRLTPMEREFLALSRYKPVTVTPVLPGLLPEESRRETEARLLEAAREIPRGFVTAGSSSR
jgi:4-amino-4-deoxy-L-arabinose transferase-like glycosyltransferase